MTFAFWTALYRKAACRTAVCCSAPLAAALLTTACAPTLDWREFVAEGTDLRVTFPCRADRHSRAVALGSAKVQMDMLVCAADDVTYAVSFFDVQDPARVTATLAEWRDTAVRNVQGAAPRRSPLQIRGMTPNEQAGRVAVTGRLPDGSAVQESAVFFVRGLRVYAATVLGAKPSAQAVDVFFGGLRFVE